MWNNQLPREIRANPSGLSRRAPFIAGKEGVEVDPHEWARRSINLEHYSAGKSAKK
jgi:hypothetical protein